MSRQQALADNLKAAQDRIAAACGKSRRDVAEVLMVAVTKYAGPEQIRELLQLGIGDLGENRVQQLTQRAAQINEFHARRLQGGSTQIVQKVRWHMIGHLQRKKVKQVLPVISLVHSVDSLRLAEEIEAHLERQQRKLPVLLQVNCSEEPQKHGVAVGAAVHLAEQIATMQHVQLAGLMTMAGYGASEREARFVFGRLREVFDELKWNKIGGVGLRHLSMGMSDDFHWAIEEGSTMVRLGSALFGGKPETDADEVED